MADMRKILLVENQQTQFEVVSNLMKRFGFESVPAIGPSYAIFIERVRVFINPQYDDEYRNNAIDEIVRAVGDWGVELIIMDHILGGAYHCLTGIQLGEEINSRLSEILPVLFLSKTERSETRRLHDYDAYARKFGRTEWVHKGFFGEEILSPGIFEDLILERTRRLLGASESELFYAKVDRFLRLDRGEMNRFEKKFEYLENVRRTDFEKIPEQVKDRVEEYYKHCQDTFFSLSTLNIIDLPKL